MTKDFLYYIVDTAGRSYYVAADGFVLVSSIPVDLENTPDGWQDKSIQYGRSTRFPGMIRSFTVPLRFVEDGAKILRYLYLTYGIQAVGNLVILKKDTLGNTGIHKDYYTGSLDFSQFTYQDRIAECNVMEGGLSELIKANENTKYEIPISVPEAVSVTFDGITLVSKVDALNYKDSLLSDTGEEIINIHYTLYVFMGFSVFDTETKYPSLSFASVTTYKGANSLDYDPADWFAEAAADIPEGVDIGIKGHFTGLVAGSAGVSIGAYIRKGGLARVVEIMPPSPPVPGVGRVDADIDTVLHLDAGEQVWFYVRNAGGGDGKSFSFDTDNRFSFTYNYRKEATQVLCLRPFYVFNELIKKITNGKYSATSTLLNGDAANTVLTSGDAVRGFVKGSPQEYDGPVIKTSLNDFIDSYNVPYNIGLGVRKTAVIERKAAFFNNTVVAGLGGVANLQITPALDHIFNTVKIGYPDQNYDDVNGRSEFNTTHVYTTPITRVAKELTLQSIYRADAFGIEFTRINLENRTTTDSSSDDSVFMVVINNALQLSRPAYSSITGVVNNTIFNTELSPKNSLYEHGNYIRIGLDKLEAGYLKYQSNSSKNAGLSTTLNGVTVTEKADVQIATLATPLFLPHIFQFDTEVPMNIVDLIETDPFGLFSFEWESRTYTGFILEASQQPAMNPAQTFKLLASINNDLSKLI